MNFIIIPHRVIHRTRRIQIYIFTGLREYRLPSGRIRPIAAAVIDSGETCGYTCGMVPPFESEIRDCLAGTLGGVFGTAVAPRRIRLSARAADASFRPPQGASPASAEAADFEPLYGARLVERIRVVNGWLLFTFSHAFFDALTARVNETLPLPAHDGGVYAVNRMLALARHTSSGCPDFPAARRALLLGVSAHESRAAYGRAVQAALTLFHAVPPRERGACLSESGALGGALARLLFASREYKR